MKNIFLCRNILPRGAGVLLKMVVTVTALLCSHLVIYAQPTLSSPADGSVTSLTPTLRWNNVTPPSPAFRIVTKIEVSECGPGTVANTINLGDYVQTPESPIQLNALEISGVTYNLSTNQLVMVSDQNFIYIPDFSNSANDRTITLNGFDDTEGIVHIGGTRYAVTEERLGRVVFFDILTTTTVINYNSSDVVQLPSIDGHGWGTSQAFNDGLEGISYHNNRIHVVKEKTNKEYYTFPVPNTFPANLTINEVDIACNVNANPFDFTDISGIHHLGLNNFGPINLDASISTHVLMLSQEQFALIETDDNCTEYGRLCLPAGQQLEGVTIDNSGRIYVVVDSDNLSNSKLYIYSNPTFGSNNSQKVVHTKIVNDVDEYDVPSGILQPGLEYCWRVSNFFPSYCNWSDSNSFTTCPVGSCDDGNVCTVNDMYDANCNCVGTFQDTDGDGVCNASDACPGQDDALIGTACNDNNPCTAGDVYDSNCNCAGTFQDSDGDGVCNANDNCPGQDDALIGTACNDGDPCTTGDVYDSNCNCAGISTPDTDGDGICDPQDPCPSDPTNSCSITYCNTQGNTVALFIQSVELNGQTNISGDDGGYGDYTGTVLPVVGSTNTVTLTPGQGAISYPVNWSIWIDFNKDGDFDDAGEQVYTGASPDATTPVTGTFNAPSGTGTTTMRVVMTRNTITPTPCAISYYGEAEDYTVEFSTDCPPELDTDGDGVCDTEDLCPNDPTDSCDIDYCDTQGNTITVFIQSVEMNGQTNISGDDSGYGDYTGTVFPMIGSINNITLTPDYNAIGYPLNWSIWIDFNKDGDFDDADEQVYTGTSPDATTPVTGTFIAPSGIGTTTMRVVTTRNTITPTPCGFFSYGEAEDYTVEFSTLCDNFPPTERACDDGDDCTTNDVEYVIETITIWGTEICVPCAGTSADTDNDGVCDAQDICPNDPADSCILDYCDIGFTGFDSDDFIASVVLNGQSIQNFDDPSRHSDYTGTILATVGDMNTIEVTNGGSSVNMYYGIWIDFNKDGDFDDTGEDVFVPTGIIPQLTLNFSALPGVGTTTMRIMMTGDYTPYPCWEYDYVYGEVEDYTVALSGGCPPDLTIHDFDVSGTYEAANMITTSQTAPVSVASGEQLTLDAGGCIQFNPGFSAEAGSQYGLYAHIDGCTAPFVQDPSSTADNKAELASEMLDIKHFPNPFREEVTLEMQLSFDSEVTVIISDINGKIVHQVEAGLLSQGAQRLTIPTQNWATGVYYYHVSFREQNTGFSGYGSGVLAKM